MKKTIFFVIPFLCFNLLNADDFNSEFKQFQEYQQQFDKLFEKMRKDFIKNMNNDFNEINNQINQKTVNNNIKLQFIEFISDQDINLNNIKNNQIDKNKIHVIRYDNFYIPAVKNHQIFSIESEEETRDNNIAVKIKNNYIINTDIKMNNNHLILCGFIKDKNNPKEIKTFKINLRKGLNSIIWLKKQKIIIDNKIKYVYSVIKVVTS